MSDSTREFIEANTVHNEGGDPELPATFVAEHLGRLRVIDVREPHELSGPLGAVEGVENMPLLAVLGRASALARASPVVLLCRSGRRSGLAATAIREHGGCAVSVEGGMIAWNLEVLKRTDIIERERVANTQVLAEAVYRTNGLPEVAPRWVQQNLGRFRLVDVREAMELEMHGKVAQSEHVPLGQFMEYASRLDRDAPIVVMCASGGRSGRAARALESAGFSACASMEGGMFGWRANALPVVSPTSRPAS